MIGRRKRHRTLLNYSSEDENPQSKKQSRSSANLYLPVLENNHNKTERSINSSSDYSLKRNKTNKKRVTCRPTTITEDTSSSENEEIVHPKIRQRYLRALSDYDSGNDNNPGKPSSSSTSSTSYNENTDRPITQTTAEGDRIKSECGIYEMFNRYRNILSFNAPGEPASSDDEIILPPSRRGSMRALSDYETGDSSDKAVKNSTSSFNVAGQSSSSSCHVNEECNSLSEDNSLIMRGKRNKRSCIIFHSSDSSDSEMPIKSQSLRKRMRITTTSEESDAENLNRASQSGRNRRQSNRVNRRLESAEGSSSQSARNIRHQRTRPSRLLNTNSRGRRTPAEAMNDPSSSDSDVRSFRIRIHQDLPSSLPNTRQRSREENEIKSTGNRSRTYRTRRGSQLRSYNTSSSDSDSSFIYSSPRRRGAVLAIPESDTDESHTLRCDMYRNELDNTADTVVSGNNMLSPVRKVSRNSSDSDGESEKCTICLARFDTQEVGSPGSCDHSFCTPCIQEWAKTSNTCPVDRKPFEEITVRSHFEGEFVCKIKVQPPPPVNFWESDDLFEEVANIIVSLGGFPSDYDYASPSDDMDELCSVCNRDTQTGNLIECDFCNNVFHMTCLNPPVNYIPVGDWFCPECTNIEMVSSSSTSQSD